MRIVGIEFASSNMNYVGIDNNGKTIVVVTSNRVALGSTRERDALVVFQDAIRTLMNDFAPDCIAIKAKPETGQMRSGAAAMKMEGIVLANAPCPVEFVSGQKINKLKDEDKSLYGYLQPAFKAALVVCNLKSE